MPKKLTIEFVREQFEKEKYTLLTNEYINSKTPLEYICFNNHRRSIIWSSWQQGHRCAECFIDSRRYTIDFVREQFEKDGYVLLTAVYTGCYQELEYICPNNHSGGICFSNWVQGHRCVECGGTKKLTIKFIRDKIEKENYKLLTKKYTGNKQYLQVVCPNNHEYFVKYNDWQQGYRCQKCWYESNRGDGSVRWDKNLTKKDRLCRRALLGYNEWKYLVKKRDSFTCQICGDNKGGNLVSHHLESYHNNKDLRIVLENGVCLCESCHKKFHRTYGNKSNTKEQFEEFKNKYGTSVA
jgi:hypothetical protein